MDLQHIAFEAGWRELVPPSLETYLVRLEQHGVTFSWALGPDHTYLFSSALPTGAHDRAAVTLVTCDGSETPRHAISEVILGTMTAKGQFETLNAPTGPRRGLK